MIMGERLFNPDKFDPPIIVDGTDGVEGSWIDRYYGSIDAAKDAGLSFDQWAELNPDAAWIIEVLNASEEIDGPAF